MKNPLFSTLLAASFLVLPGCDRTPDAGADRADGDHATHPGDDEESLLREIAELEARERELQQQIEAERLAAERDRLERDRESLDRDRRELEARRDAGEVPPAPATAPRALPGDGARPGPGRVRVPVSSRGGATGDYRTFYDQLEPHGDWFETPDYGYVYQPQVARRDDWRPYTEGRWVQSQQGWTWASDEPFGWATYHYGRWAPTRRHGWVWIPGDEWAPAWVTWRHSDDHVGWAPLPPETLYHEEIVYDSGFDSRYGIAPDYYTFVPVSRFDQPVARHYLPPARNVTLIDITINITNIIVRPDHIHVGGLDPAWFHRRTGRHFPRYHLERHDDRRDRRPDADFHGDTLTCYAPPVEAPWNERVRPLHVADRWQDVELRRSPGGVAPEARQRFRKVRREREARAAESVQQGAGRLVMEQQNVAIALQDRRGRLETRREEPAAADPVATPETPAQVETEIAGTGDSDTPAATIPTPAAEAGRPRAEEAAGEAEQRVDRVRREPGERRGRLRQRQESPDRGQAPPEPEAPEPATPAETAPASQPEPDAPEPARSPEEAETPEAPEAAPTDARIKPAGVRARQLEQRRQALRQRQQELRQRQLERGRAPAAGRRPQEPGAPKAPQAPAEAAPANPEASAPTPEPPADPRRRAIRERREALQQRVAERQEQARPAAKRRKQPPAPPAGEPRQGQQAEENATQPNEQPPREPEVPRPNERQPRQQEAADQARQQAGQQRQQKEAPRRAREEQQRQQEEAAQRAREEQQRQQVEAAERAREEQQRQQEEAAERARQEQERQREPAPPEAD